MTRRLFLFAAHDPEDRVSESALWYLTALKALGEVRFAADNKLDSSELEKLSGLCEVVFAAPHGEYDFGSYKRAFAGADLSEVDYLYLVNDSVAGPLYPLAPYLEKMEGAGTDAFALAWNPSRRGAHLQSWFIGLKPSVFRAPWFAAFLEGVRGHDSMDAVYTLYETGFTRLLEEHGASYSALFTLPGKKVYNAVAALCRQGFPFLKKRALTRHGGSLGGQVLSVLQNTEPSLAAAVKAEANRLYGAGYMERFLTRNPFKLSLRYLRYLAGKVAGR